jgi:hypothetical protein
MKKSATSTTKTVDQFLQKISNKVSVPINTGSAAINDSSSEDEGESLSQRHARLKKGKAAAKSAEPRSSTSFENNGASASSAPTSVATSAVSVGGALAQSDSDHELCQSDSDHEVRVVTTVTVAEQTARALAAAKASGSFIDLSGGTSSSDEGSSRKAAAASAVKTSHPENASSASNSVSGSSSSTSSATATVYNAFCVGTETTKTTKELAATLAPLLPLATVKESLYELVVAGKLCKTKDIPPTWQIN